MVNPYQPPVHTADPVPASAPVEIRKRPVSPLVFGILSLVFGGGGLLAVPCLFIMLNLEPFKSEDLGVSPNYLAVSQVFNVVGSIVLVIAGIGLIVRKEWCRKLFLGYCVVTIVWTLGNSLWAILQATNMSGANAIGNFVGGVAGLLGLVFPILGLIFLTRPSVRASFLPVASVADQREAAATSR